jgi:citrate synthase
MDNLDDPRLNYNYRTREWGTVPMDSERARFQWVSEVAYKNVHRIVARGYDTTELVEQGYGLTDVLFVDFQARIPLLEENKMLNYVMVCMFEDGLSSPANIARIVASGKTILTQAAGSSILAFGHAYGAYQAIGKLMNGILAQQEQEGKPLAEVAEAAVKAKLDDAALGISGLMLKDPMARRMIARAEKLGVAGKYVPLMKEMVKAAQKLSPSPVDVDLLGATAAVMFDIGFTPEATWGILSVTRAFATGAHYCEEIEREEPVRLGQTLTPKEWYDGPEDRPVPTLDERKKVAKAMEAQTPEEWKKTFIERQKIKGSGWAIVEEIDDPKRKI